MRPNQVETVLSAVAYGPLMIGLYNRQCNATYISLVKGVHAMSNLEYINPWYQRYVCCTVLMRPNQVETVLSGVAYSLVPHDD